MPQCLFPKDFEPLVDPSSSLLLILQQVASISISPCGMKSKLTPDKRHQTVRLEKINYKFNFFQGE